MEVGIGGTPYRRLVYISWRRDIRSCSWDAHIENVIEKGEAHIGKVDVTLGTCTSILGTRDVF